MTAMFFAAVIVLCCIGLYKTARCRPTNVGSVWNKRKTWEWIWYSLSGISLLSLLVGLIVSVRSEYDHAIQSTETKRNQNKMALETVVGTKAIEAKDFACELVLDHNSYEERLPRECSYIKELLEEEELNFVRIADYLKNRFPTKYHLSYRELAEIGGLLERIRKEEGEYSRLSSILLFWYYIENIFVQNRMNFFIFAFSCGLSAYLGRMLLIYSNKTRPWVRGGLVLVHGTKILVHQRDGYYAGVRIGEVVDGKWWIGREVFESDQNYWTRNSVTTDKDSIKFYYRNPISNFWKSIKDDKFVKLKPEFLLYDEYPAPIKLKKRLKILFKSIKTMHKE